MFPLAWFCFPGRPSPYLMRVYYARRVDFSVELPTANAPSGTPSTQKEDSGVIQGEVDSRRMSMLLLAVSVIFSSGWNEVTVRGPSNPLNRAGMLWAGRWRLPVVHADLCSTSDKT